MEGTVGGEVGGGVSGGKCLNALIQSLHQMTGAGVPGLNGEYADDA